LAQIVNVLQSVVMTEGDQMYLTPTYHALRLHKPHLGATALPVDVAGGATLPNGSSAVSATASQNGDSITITIVNRHISESASVRIDGAAGALMASGELLAADAPNAINTVENPNRVSTKPLSVAQDGDGWLVELPPHSMATISF
jgi:alpha-N-arabinofuranosidase